MNCDVAHTISVDTFDNSDIELDSLIVDLNTRSKIQDQWPTVA